MADGRAAPAAGNRPNSPTRATPRTGSPDAFPKVDVAVDGDVGRPARGPRGGQPVLRGVRVAQLAGKKPDVAARNVTASDASKLADPALDAIAYAISKERITREKHDTGFFQEVVDYCLKAEGISLEDVDLVVRN